MAPAPFLLAAGHDFALIAFYVVLGAAIVTRERRIKKVLDAVAATNDLVDDSYLGVAAVTIEHRRARIWLDEALDIGNLHSVDGFAHFRGIRTEFSLPAGEQLETIFREAGFEFAPGVRVRFEMLRDAHVYPESVRPRLSLVKEFFPGFRLSTSPPPENALLNAVVLPPLAIPKRDGRWIRRIQKAMAKLQMAVVYVGVTFAIQKISFGTLSLIVSLMCLIALVMYGLAKTRYAPERGRGE